MNIRLLRPVASWLGVSPTQLMIGIGTVNAVSTKVVKYLFFDAGKEMAYLPLTTETKRRGKASVDLLGSRFGKFMASWIQNILLFFMGTTSVLDTVHILLPCLCTVGFLWLLAIFYLSRQMNPSEAAGDNREAENKKNSEVLRD